MSDTKHVDDLTFEEIADIEFYASDKNKKTFKTSEGFIQWLNE